MWGPNLHMPHSPFHLKPWSLIDNDNDDYFAQYHMQNVDGRIYVKGLYFS